MKQAEEYRDEWMLDTENNTDVMDADCESLLEQFRQCQLDARISALEEVAELLKEKQRHSAEAGQIDAAITVQECRKIILSLATKLKEGKNETRRTNQSTG